MNRNHQFNQQTKPKCKYEAEEIYSPKPGNWLPDRKLGKVGNLGNFFPRFLNPSFRF